MQRAGLVPRALGRSDYPTELPLREVYTIAKHCAGAVILGFSQIRADQGVIKPGIKGREKTLTSPMHFPTPWNHLEAGILYSLHLPMLVFKEESISGGIFDHGVTDVFIHKMPIFPLNKKDEDGLRAVFMKWQAGVRNHYYMAD